MITSNVDSLTLPKRIRRTLGVTLASVLVSGAPPLVVPHLIAQATPPPAPPQSQSASVANLTPAERDDLAERYRANLLRELSPDDWYKCYADPKLSDFNSPMYDAIRKAKISDEKLKPFLRMELFDRFMMLFWMKMGGVNVPQDAFSNCNNPKPSETTAGRTSGRFMLRGLSKVLGEVLQAIGVSNIAFLTDRAAREVADGEPELQRRTDDEIDAMARQGRATAKSIVANYLSPEDAATFESDAPRLQARKLALSAAALIEKRQWPNAFFLTMANFPAGVGGYMELQHYYETRSHPDVQAWPRMTHYERGAALRRLYADMMRAHADIAAGKITLEKYAAAKTLSIREDFKRFIGESFGLDMLGRYEEAERNGDNALPGYHADDLRTAAYVYVIALRYITVVSM
jgi:hypothetical protein